jgi:hypothetical protein
MRKLVILLSAILLITSASLAQENMGARPIGMGGAFTGVADDVNAIFVNPAGIGYIRSEMASVSTKISEGKEYTIIGGVEHTSMGSFGIGYVGSSSPLEDSSEYAYVDEGNTPVKAIDQTLVLSYARELNEFMVIPKSMGRLSLGTNLKLSSIRIANAKGLSQPVGSTVNLDLAAVFKPNDDFSCGVSLKNFMDKEATLEEGEGRTGLATAFGVSGKAFNKSIIWSAEGSSLGLEWRPIKGLALRVGKDGEYSTAGFGINVNGFGVDYGYMEKEVPVHYVAVSVAIDRSKPEADLRQASLDMK